MKKFILLISLVGLASAKPAPDAHYAYAPVYGYSNPVPLSANQFHAQDEIGQYNYGYSNQDSAKSELRTADGVVTGSYSYVDANGIIQTTNYISDALGFRVAATNLPVAPVAEAVAVAAEAPAAEAVAVEAKAEPVVVAAEPEPAAVEVKAEEAPVVAAVEPQQSVIVPYVQYAHLPYATAYPYYAAQHHYAPVYSVPAPVQQVYTHVVDAAVPAPIQQVYTQVVDAAVPAVEQPKEAVVEEAAPVAAVPVEATQEIITVPILTQYHSQDEQGSYKFGYSEASATREEESKNGVITGHYNYIDTDGQIQTVNYVADEAGFRVTGGLPLPVEDTPEVVAAREEHLKLVAETIANQPAEEEVVAEAAPVEAVQYVAQPDVAVAAVQPVVSQQLVVQAEPQAYVAAAPVVQQVVAQPQYVVSQPQPYVAVQPQQYVVSQPQQYVAVQPQQYAINQPVVAQPYLVGQPVVYAEPAAPVAEPVAAASNQFHAQDELGQYEYGYANEHSVKTEHKTADGVVRGSYSYVDANGVVQRVDYISDALGFRVAATNLPVHQQPIPIVDQARPELQPVVEETVTDAPALPVTEAATEVPVPADYAIEIRSGLPELETVVVEAAVDAVPATVVAKEEVAVPAQEVVQAVATPYAAHYIVPGYSASYAPVYQPYAANFGYYYNPSYVGASGALTHSQYHAQDEIGQYNYGYATADSTKSEIKTADGIVQGSYSYVDANVVVQTTNYISDQWGFRVAATNLPVAVAAPEQTA